MSTDKDLSGRVAVVTGASRNIGRAIALTLAEAGAAVTVNGHSSRAAADAVVSEIEGRGGKALAFMADVTDQAAVERMAAATVERFGRIDILVNNAAGRPERKLDEMSLADWRGVLASDPRRGFPHHQGLPAAPEAKRRRRHHQHRWGIRPRRHQAPRTRRHRQGRPGRLHQGVGA